jgi:hypothetical protein
LVELPGADHGFRVVRAAAPSAAELRHWVVDEVTRFAREQAGAG